MDHTNVIVELSAILLPSVLFPTFKLCQVILIPNTVCKSPIGNRIWGNILYPPLMNSVVSESGILLSLTHLTSRPGSDVLCNTLTICLLLLKSDFISQPAPSCDAFRETQPTFFDASASSDLAEASHSGRSYCVCRKTESKHLTTGLTPDSTHVVLEIKEAELIEKTTTTRQREFLCYKCQFYQQK